MITLHRGPPLPLGSSYAVAEKIVADARSLKSELGTVFFFKEDLESEQANVGIDFSRDT
jgi:hypothetical protein